MLGMPMSSDDQKTHGILQFNKICERGNLKTSESPFCPTITAWHESAHAA